MNLEEGDARNSDVEFLTGETKNGLSFPMLDITCHLGPLSHCQCHKPTDLPLQPFGRKCQDGPRYNNSSSQSERVKGTGLSP